MAKRTRSQRRRKRIRNRLRRAAKRKRYTFSSTEIVAIIDTNVVMDLLSCHDGQNAIRLGTPEQQKYRHTRTCAALRLAIHLNEIGAATLSPGNEFLEKALQIVPPDVPGIFHDFLRIWIFFLKSNLLPKWRMGSLPPSVPTNIRGNIVDDTLIELAKKYGCPIISNEGLGEDGLDPKNRLRKRAARAGVRVFTADQFCYDKVSITAMENFMHEFNRLAPTFRAREPDHRNAQNTLESIYNYYRDLFIAWTAVNCTVPDPSMPPL